MGVGVQSNIVGHFPSFELPSNSRPLIRLKQCTNPLFRFWFGINDYFLTLCPEEPPWFSCPLLPFLPLSFMSRPDSKMYFLCKHSLLRKWNKTASSSSRVISRSVFFFSCLLSNMIRNKLKVLTFRVIWNRNTKS